MSKTLFIDADNLLYLTTFARDNVGSGFEAQDGDTFDNSSMDMKPLKDKFKSLVHDVTASCEIESAIGTMSKFKKVVCVFTDSTNFRYDIFPDYKKKRTNDKPKEFYKLKSWAIKKFGIISDEVEADDIVSYYARKGHPIASADKDVLKGTPGYHYDIYHKCFIKTSKKAANAFLCLQALMGDPSDDIPGIPRVGEKTAEKLLGDDKTLKRVFEIYEEKGLDKEYALTMIRLVHMGQIKKITRKGKIKLELYK